MVKLFGIFYLSVFILQRTCFGAVDGEAPLPEGGFVDRSGSRRLGMPVDRAEKMDEKNRHLGGSNTCPVAMPDFWAVFQDTTTDLTPIIKNDNYTDDARISFVDVTQPPNATVLIVEDGANVTFVPESDYSGVQDFNYTITDGECNSTAQVTVIVRKVNYILLDNEEDVCRATLEENTLYKLTSNVRCNNNGLTLSSNVVLDCRGNTISGNRYFFRRNPTYGILIRPRATNVVIRNCNVFGFFDGIYNNGGDVFITNVRSGSNGSSGIDNRQGNMQIECSKMDGNDRNGVFSTRGGSIDIAGSLIERNSDQGVLIGSGKFDVSCSEILSNFRDGIELSRFDDNEGIIRDTIVANTTDGDNIEVSSASVILNNVAACNPGDFRYDFWAEDEGFQLTSYDGLTCGRVAPSLEVTCSYPCPADSSSLELPETCPICPNGVGTYWTYETADI